MKRLLFGLAAISALIGTPALAADLTYKAPCCSATPVWSWTGFYIGGNVGGGWATDQVTRLDFPSADYPLGYSSTKNLSGILGGGQVGYDFQLNRIVLGVLADADATGLTGTTPELGLLGDELSTHSSKINWIADAGGRVGLAWGTWLPYVKGGAAWINYHDTGNDTSVPAGTFLDSSTQSKTFTGWFIGDGIEFKIAPNLSAFAEYDYYRFTGNTVQTEVVGPAVGAYHDNSNSGNISVIKAGLNWRFNWASPAPSGCCVTK